MALPESYLAERDYSETTITGTVSRVNYCRDDWSAGRLATQSEYFTVDRDISFNVRARIREGETIILHGKWNKDPKWGWQFKADTISYPMPEPTADGLAHYIATNPDFKGIGPAKAKLIANAFPDNFEEILREHPEQIAAAGKLSLEQIETLREQWIAKADVNAISTWLASYGFTHCQIKRLAEQYGNRARQVLEENPYVLCDEVYGFGFARTDIIALSMGVAKNHPGRIKSCLLDMVKAESDNGHTWVDRKTLIKNAVSKLAFDSLEASQMIRDQLQVLIDDGQLVSVQQYESSERIAWRWIYEQEMALMGWFSASHEIPPQCVCSTCTGYLLEQLVNVDGIAEPNADQTNAIHRVLNSRISVLTGEAGTGKTFTVSAIYRAFCRMDKAVGLCAPTGKAAKRMSALAQGADASTIHRFLGYNPISGEWFYGPDNKLPYDLVIVDEVSMCDISLLHRLLSAIDFNKTQLLFVGDHQQLPPIGAGNVLRDVLDYDLLPSSRLTECIRAAGDLKLNCNAILQGKCEPTTPVLPAGGREWRVVDSLESNEDVMNALGLLMNGQIEEWGFDPIEDCQIITPYNKGPLGVRRINAEMQRIWQFRKYGRQLPTPPVEEKRIRTQFYPGDKVMQIRNDYTLDVMNGTTGVVLSADYLRSVQGDATGKLVIQFEDMTQPVEIALDSDKIHNVVLAYACTVHKVQGSEYPLVVAVIHSAHSYMLSRNLMYTACTRARKQCVILGNKVGIRRAVRTTKPVERRTFMACGKVDGDGGYE